MSGIDREPQLYWRVTAGDPETRVAIERARQVTTQAGVSVQCECPECAFKRDEQIANAAVVASGVKDGAWDYRYRGVVTQMDADIARAAMANGIVKVTVEAMTDEEADAHREAFVAGVMEAERAEANAWYAIWGPHTYDLKAREDYERISGMRWPEVVSKMWGMITTEPKEAPVAPPPTRWLTNLKPDTDTVEQRAAFLKKEGLACPTEITPDDIEAINHGKMW